MRLIDADALKKAVEGFPNCYNGWSDAYDKSFIIGAIEEQPSIKPRRGEWIMSKPEEEGFGAVFQCSRCSCEVDCVPTNFCPNCGAEMRERESE